MQLSLFGYELTKKTSKEKEQPSIEIDRDGTHIAPASFGTDPLSFVNTQEVELIEAYRRISHFPEVSSAIDEVVNEVVVMDQTRQAVELDTTEAIKNGLSEQNSELLIGAFKKIYKLLDFELNGYDLVRDWYIDSRIAFIKNFKKESVSSGIESLTRLDVKKLKRVKIVDDRTDLYEIVDEFFVYVRKPDNSSNNSSMTTLRMTRSQFSDFQKEIIFKLNVESVAEISSGLIDRNSNTIYGYLHKAVRVANQLDLMENALVIFRVSRAHDVRAFYIDTGNAPPAKAKAKVEQVKNMFNRKVKYDTVRGSLTSNARTMDLTEDYFLGRDGGGKTTEIANISPQASQSGLEDVEMRRTKLYAALNVPPGRFKEANALFGNQSEITREELKFHRFITRVRNKFSGLFLELLKTEIVVTGKMTLEEFEEIANTLNFDYNKDNFFAEIKELEIASMRIAAAEEATLFVGKYFSHETVRTKYLGQTTQETIEEDKKIKAESSNTILNKPEE